MADNKVHLVVQEADRKLLKLAAARADTTIAEVVRAIVRGDNELAKRFPLRSVIDGKPILSETPCAGCSGKEASPCALCPLCLRRATALADADRGYFDRRR